jgi:hypothetical protein
MTHFAEVNYLGVIHVLFYLWPCNPGMVTGRTYRMHYECEALTSVYYDTDKVVLFCIDGELTAQCPLEEETE